MKYAIVYLIKGKAEKYHQKLVKEIAEKFNIIYTKRNSCPSHITLKFGFKINKPKRAKEIEIILKKFCRKEKVTNIKIIGFGHFNNKNIFLNVKFSDKSLIVHKRLIKQLKKLKWLEWSKHEREKNFHITIAYHFNKKKFNKIWKYLDRYHPRFNLRFDNIAIIRRLRNNSWVVYKEFSLRV